MGFRKLQCAVAFILTTLLVSASVNGQPPASESLPQLENLHPAQKAVYAVMRRGTDWLIQAQQGNGLFHPGFNVAVNEPLEAAHFYHQAEAAATLAKVSRLTANPRTMAAAQQACLTLLSSTKADAKDPQVRYTMFPEISVNRLGSAGLLLRVVHELPQPAGQLLAEAEGLAHYIKSCQLPDGSLRSQPSGIQVAGHENNSVEMGLNWIYEGLALQGLAVSLQNSPAPWKMEVLTKAAGFYCRDIKQIPVAAMPGLISGMTEVCLRSKDKTCVAAVFNMADAVCNVQVNAEAGKMSWSGGFLVNFQEKNQAAPSAEFAGCVTGLCDAYRLAKAMGDAARMEKYRQAAERGVQYYGTLQYTGSGVAHFAEPFQAKIVGSFRLGPQEPVVRMKDTATCVVAAATYLSDVAGVALAPVESAPALPPSGK